VTRIARCCCGSLHLDVTGEPAIVGACHCMECQRRTGSALSIAALFPKAQVHIEGPRKLYQRGSDSGQKVEFQFCPNCGSTVFWHVEFAPDLVAIAFGAFADQSLPSPTVSIWEATKYPWVNIDHELTRFERQFQPEDLAKVRSHKVNHAAKRRR
jgi:hypothetical protein